MNVMTHLRLVPATLLVSTLLDFMSASA